jgi:hypothetical protein
MNRHLRIVIPGGNGQVGTLLSRHFHAQGHDVVVLARKSLSTPWRVVNWDGEHLGDWKSELEKSDLVINLAGRSVNCRYQRQIVRQSWTPEPTRRACEVGPLVNSHICRAFGSTQAPRRFIVMSITDQWTSRQGKSVATKPMHLPNGSSVSMWRLTGRQLSSTQ